MRTITGRPLVDDVIAFRNGPTHAAIHPWPADTLVSAGHGVVLVRGEDRSYQTLFMEVYPPGASFIRGEGATVEECEASCWAQYQRALHCVDGHTHHWEPRRTGPDGSPGHRYTNGAGFCRYCATFESQAFTGEQLGQHCRVCGAGTTWHADDDGWLCRDHACALAEHPH